MGGRASDLTGTRINTAADTNNKSTADSEIIYTISTGVFARRLA